MISTSVIIVSYNNEKRISKLLGSFEQNIDLIVVDNTSSDRTVELVKKKFPKVRLIKNNKNLGFAAAVNQGVRKAKGDVLLINPDTIFSKDLVTTLREKAYKKKSIAAAAPKILNDDGTLQPNCGNFPTALNIFLDRIPVLSSLTSKSELIRENDYYLKEKHPDWIAGTCMYIKRSALEKVGLFDEKYFMYLEDVDWCYRAKTLGFKTVYTPNTLITHFNEGKSKEKSANKFYNMRKGFLTFFKKYKMKKDAQMFKVLLMAELEYKRVFRPNSPEWENVYKKCYKLL